MARLKQNAVLSGLSGKIGKDHHARHTRDGKTIICQNPDFSNRQFSEAQLHVQSGMKAAAAYARVASRENPIYAELARKKAKKKVKNAYNVAARGLVQCTGHRPHRVAQREHPCAGERRRDGDQGDGHHSG